MGIGKSLRTPLQVQIEIILFPMGHWNNWRFQTFSRTLFAWHFLWPLIKTFEVLKNLEGLALSNLN